MEELLKNFQGVVSRYSQYSYIPEYARPIIDDLCFDLERIGQSLNVCFPYGGIKFLNSPSDVNFDDGWIQVNSPPNQVTSLLDHVLVHRDLDPRQSYVAFMNKNPGFQTCCLKLEYDSYQLGDGFNPIVVSPQGSSVSTDLEKIFPFLRKRSLEIDLKMSFLKRYKEFSKEFTYDEFAFAEFNRYVLHPVSRYFHVPPLNTRLVYPKTQNLETTWGSPSPVFKFLFPVSKRCHNSKSQKIEDMVVKQCERLYFPVLIYSELNKDLSGWYASFDALPDL